jgi:hypothetical protein
MLQSQVRAAKSELDRMEREKRLAANPNPIRSSYYIAPQSPAVVASSPYYRGYPYSYSQPQPSTSTFAIATPGAPTPSAIVPPSAASHTGPVPVQLPLASLPALHALSIIPVPSTSVPAEGPQPAAVLRGSSSNGTILNLEINVASLQPAQMSGLAVILNSLMSRSTGAAAPPAVLANGTSGA